MEQDSFEDFIKLNRPNVSTNREDDRIKNVLVTALRKKECEDQAIKIVELLIEGKIRPETFLKSIYYLNPSYYQDIVEERALTKICGYPLCGVMIQPFQPKKFAISTKTNKVYDLDEQRNFCSIYCFNASNHIKEQIDDSPLWLRNFNDAPEFNLLPKNKGQSHSGVDVRSKKVINNNNFTSVAHFTENSLDDFIQNENTNKFGLSTFIESDENDSTNKILQKVETRNVNHLETVEEESLDPIKYNIDEQISEKSPDVLNKSNLKSRINDKDLEAIINKIKLNKKASTKKVIEVSSPTVEPRRLKLINDQIKNGMVKSTVKLIDPLPLTTISGSNKIKIETAKTKLKDRNLLELKFTVKNPVEVERQVRAAIGCWITLDTLIYVHGESRIKKILDENKLSQHFNRLNIAEAEVSQQKKYADICKKLQLQELLDEQWDKANLGPSKLKPLPDYNKLKEEIKEADIKVKTFYGGSLYEKDDCNYPKKDEGEEEAPAVLPLMDTNSQNALRRRVLLNSLTKGIQVFSDLNYRTLDLTTDLQELVKTFKLTADNIVFKPILWSYLGFVCLKILALKDETLRNVMQEEVAKELEDLIFGELPGKDLISSCLQIVENIDTFIENYITSLDT